MLKQGNYETLRTFGPDFGYGSGGLKIRVRQDVLPFLISSLDQVESWKRVDLYHIKIRKGDNKRAILYATCTENEVKRLKNIIQNALHDRDQVKKANKRKGVS